MNTPIPMTAADITAELEKFIHRDQCTELRALHVGGPRRTVAGWFDGRHLHDLARTALALTRQAAGVYFIPNPVHPDLLARFPNRAEEIRGKRVSLTTDADILERRYLLIDFDPDRIDGNNDQPSTQDEWDHADSASAVVEMDLTHTGWRRPIRMLSGNGVHLVFPLSTPLPAKISDLDADPLREALAVYRHWKFCDRVTVDPNTYTAARMLKVPGTWARKGEATADRPYRTAKILETPDDWPAPGQPPAVEPTTPAGVAELPVGEGSSSATTPAATDATRERKLQRQRRREDPPGQTLFGEDAGVDPAPAR